MSRIAIIFVGGFLALGLVGCDVDVEDREPDVIDTDPGVDIEVDDEPAVTRPDVDVDVETGTPDTVVPDVDVDVDPPQTENTTPDSDPAGG